MDLAARRTRSGVLLGLQRPRSAEVVDLATCLVLHPALARLLDPLRALLGGLKSGWRQASAVANLLDDGPDLLLRADAAPTVDDRIALAAFARAQGLPRVAWAVAGDSAEPVAELRPPVITLSGVAVRPPPGAFLQATESGEQAIIAAVLAGLPGRLPPRATIVECHAGCGTLTFALARRARVQAWEGDAATVTALREAAGRSDLSGMVRAERRDLARQPLQARELAHAAAVVLDPPHAGAAAQIPPLAASGVPTIIYVSCNPAALARDAAELRRAGYRLATATPIDQFLFSARLESVSVFRHEPR
jgi:23S rRNA (uracil1939-C5)-methyltransferase